MASFGLPIGIIRGQWEYIHIARRKKGVTFLEETEKV